MTPQAKTIGSTGRRLASAGRRLLVVAVVVAQVAWAFAPTAPAQAAAASSALPRLSVTPGFATGEPRKPSVTAKAAILIDASTGKILYSRNANERLPMASTTKIMTAIIVLETLDPKQKVQIPADAVVTIGSVAHLAKGEKLTVEDLLRALLVVSGNDAAITLAHACAGSSSAFIAEMNEKATALGLKNTHFRNSNGLSDDGHYSSAKDLASLARYAMKFDLFRRIVQARGFFLPTIPGQKPRAYPTTDKLAIACSWITGIKTGSTPAAGYCLVSSATKDGVSLISVILGAKDTDTRWAEAKALLQYGFSLYPNTCLVHAGQSVGELPSLDVPGESVDLVAEGPLAAHLSKGEVATGVIHLDRSGLLRVKSGDRLGFVEFSANGKLVGSVRLLAGEPPPHPVPGTALDSWRTRSPIRVVLAPPTY